jgi:hypothetical protein
MGDSGVHARIYYDSLKGRNHVGDLDVDERNILSGVLRKYKVRVWN